MRKKRLTIIIAGFDVGGAQNMVYEQLRHADVEQYDIRVLSVVSKRGTWLEEKLEAMFPVTYLGHSGGRVTPWRIAQILMAIQKTKPDIVHAHLSGAGFAAMWAQLTGKPLVITIHSKPSQAFPPKMQRQIKRAMRLKSTHVVAVSEDNARMVKDYYGLDDTRCSYINNGIDLERFSRKDHEGFTLINVARQDENKNQAALLRCFARLHREHPETKLLLLGDGPCHEALKELATELGIDAAVTFTGNVSNTEAYYALSDLFVLCSHREAMPLSVLEAMATPMPIVSTRVGGLSDVVQDNGILVEDHDEDVLYEAILQVYRQSPEDYQKMCDASGRIVQAYSNVEMARAYEAIYAAM